MWILPNNHPLYSAFAQDRVASKEDLSELSKLFIGNRWWSALMWKSKPLSFGTWLNKWNRVYWLPHLFTRMLKPFAENSFMEKYTESLAVIPVNRSALQDKEMETAILDTFGRIYQNSLNQLSLFSASLKMSPDISQWDLEKFIEAYEIWGMLLRRESTQRRRLAHLTKEKGFLSSHLKWPTPRARDHKSAEGTEITRNARPLNEAVKNWPTPISSEVRQGYQNRQNGKKGSQESLTTKVIDGLPNQVNLNSIGKPLVLNPEWVFQLMGTALERTFCEWREMPSLNKRRNSHLSTYSTSTLAPKLISYDISKMSYSEYGDFCKTPFGVIFIRSLLWCSRRKMMVNIIRNIREINTLLSGKSITTYYGNASSMRNNLFESLKINKEQRKLDYKILKENETDWL